MAIENIYTDFDITMPFIFEFKNTELEMYLYKDIKDEIREQVISFHKDYFKLSHKWKIGMPISSEKYEINKVAYWKVFEDKLREYFYEKNVIGFSFSGIHNNKMVYGPTSTRIYFENAYKDIYDLEGLRTEFDLLNLTAPRLPIFEVFGEEYNEKLIDKSQESYIENRVMFSFGLACNCLFPHLFRGEEIIDNRALAYRNIPRYNSFLRDLKSLGKKYKMDLKTAFENDVFIGRNPNEKIDGILIDGKIIYQEDIEEKKISLPFI